MVFDEDEDVVTVVAVVIIIITVIVVVVVFVVVVSVGEKRRPRADYFWRTFPRESGGLGSVPWFRDERMSEDFPK